MCTFKHGICFATYMVQVFTDIHVIRERPLDLQGGGGGAWVFQSGQNIFFCHFQGQNIFFQSIMSQNIFFSQAILGQNIFSIQYKFGSNFLVEPQFGYKTIILRLSAVYLYICPTAMILSGVNCQFQIHCKTTLYDVSFYSNLTL